MTVQNTTRFIRANGDGAVVAFQFSFPAKLTTDVTVKKIVNSTGIATTQTVGVDYTITLNTVTEGGTVTYTVAPTALEDSFIVRETTQDQQTGLPIGGNFPEISVENEIDRSRMIDIELQEQIGRCINISDTESLTGINAPMGSSAANRALKLWAWSTDGLSLILGETIGNFLGDWTTATSYVVRDLVKDTTNNNIYFCNTAHTSTGALPISTNADVAKWDLLVDAESASDSAAAAAVSEANAATSETNAGISETNADADATATAADVVSTNADVVLTGIDVTSAAASASAASTSETNAAASAATIPTVFSTTADPTANSDAANTDTNGNFAVNSQWTNTTTNETFTCKDSTATAAIWHGDQGVKGATIADSGTPDIFNNGDGETMHLAGTTTITDFPDAPRVGMWRKIIFDGVRTLTHGSGITLQGGANITTAVNDYAFVYADTVSAFEVIYFKADGTAIIQASGTTLGTEQASTSGTAIDFTAIPAGTKSITIMIAGVSLDGTEELLIQIGDSGGVETSGYLSGVSSSSANITSTAGFILVTGGGATSVYEGAIVLKLENSSAFTWVCTSSLQLSAPSAEGYTGAGSKSLSAELDRIRVTSTGTPDDFDAGVINIQFE